MPSLWIRRFERTAEREAPRTDVLGRALGLACARRDSRRHLRWNLHADRGVGHRRLLWIARRHVRLSKAHAATCLSLALPVGAGRRDGDDHRRLGVRLRAFAYAVPDSTAA